MPLEPERLRLLADIRRRFGVELNGRGELSTMVSEYRHDVTAHWIGSDREYVTPTLNKALREWLEEKGWQYSRQLVVEPPIERIYIGRLIPVAIDVAYHVTRQASLPGIIERGLLPGSSERQTTGAERRRDCDGNIYVCEHLGMPGDHDKSGTKSAHWWRGELASKHGSNVAEWLIVEIGLGGLPGLRVSRDIWSRSGLVISNVHSISWKRLRMIYP
jgi:hypothetical protein